MGEKKKNLPSAQSCGVNRASRSLQRCPCPKPEADPPARTTALAVPATRRGAAALAVGQQLPEAEQREKRVHREVLLSLQTLPPPLFSLPFPPILFPSTFRAQFPSALALPLSPAPEALLQRWRHPHSPQSSAPFLSPDLTLLHPSPQRPSPPCSSSSAPQPRWALP